MASNIPVIVQGNSFSLAIPLQIYYINGDQMDLQDYTPDPTDEVSIQLKGFRRNYTYTPTIDGNVANIDLSGNELADNYGVVVSVVKANGQRLRSFRTDQFFIVESSDDLTTDDIIQGLEGNVIYLNAQPFIAGADGRGIESIVKTGTSGLVDTYTITYSDNTTSTFNVTNGANGAQGAQGADGVGITSIDKTSTSGLVDTYTITMSNGTTSTFDVTNGRDGVEAPITTENVNPLYPSMLAVEGEDYTVLANKTGAWNGTTLTDRAGNYCVIIKMRTGVLSFKGRKSGYGAFWWYSAEPNSSDYTANRIAAEAFSGTSGTKVYNTASYMLMDIGTNLAGFKAWFSVNEPIEQDVITKIDDLDIKVNATYIADENLFNYEHSKGGTTANGDFRFVFECTAGVNYFVMWNDSAGLVNPKNAVGSWKEYDASNNVLVSENFFVIARTSAVFSFGKVESKACKMRLNSSTTRLEIIVTLHNGDTIETLTDKVRMYLNSDGHLTRYLYPLTLDGHPIEQPDLKGKIIACFGDSITDFGSGGITPGADGGYPFFLQKRLDNGIANYGRGNATFADYSDTDTTTNAPTRATNDHNNTISSQIRWMLADGIIPDIAIFNGGINDITKGNGYTWDIPAAVAAYPTTTAAVFQNVAMVICYAVSVLRNLNPNVKIYIGTTCKTLNASRASAVTAFAQNLRDTAEAFGLEVIDFYRYAQQPYPATASANPYYYDETHPSQLGVDLMGRVAMESLKTYVAPAEG